MNIVESLTELLNSVHEHNLPEDDKPVLLVKEDTFFAIGRLLKQSEVNPYPTRIEGILRIEVITIHGTVEIVNKNELYRVSNVINRICE